MITGRVVFAFVVGFWSAIATVYFLGGLKMKDCNTKDVLLTSDERGRYCSFNTTCGRKCTPKERDQCQWWTHAAEIPAQQSLEFMPPLSHAKDES